ncbi:RICIN domain-containing protein [Streptomyces cocklensis]|uniref:Ricin B-type lectin domain-containing protein n=1 Tax=Actinacidiphila cocklensis TaxID=887465 RepID=A0A9W4E013_9ACTN|nr:RICIN domain-containing protein [Actinacidiphila cocklensis]MDD1058604.1 RICIN domain-containing protein [Actinacidiphila cocklensis]CAG6390783.1 Ricin B-type lectin domain-containing protein [Actinacidiphila cocklensis]
MKSRTMWGTVVAVVGLAVGCGGFAGTAQAADAKAPVAVRPAAAGFFEIVNDHAGKCAEVDGNGAGALGTLIHEWSCDGEDNQWWAPTSVGSDGFFTLTNRGSGFCMNVKNGVAFDGALIDQQNCDSSKPGQLWKLQASGLAGHLQLASGFAGECLALSPNTSQNGTKVVISACSTSSAKLWHFDS